jgi:hypothetical protein
MDYVKTKEEAQRRKDELFARQQQIPSEKAKLDTELEDIRRELIGLEQILDGVEFVTCDEGGLFWELLGLTDSIRKLLSETDKPLVPTEIRYALEAKGVKGTSSKNLLINIHKTLERIGSELTETMTPDGKPAYKREIPWQRRHAVANATFKLADRLAAERSPVIKLPESVNAYLEGLKKEQDKKK